MSPVDLATASLNADTALMSAFAGTWDSTMCKGRDQEGLL